MRIILQSKSHSINSYMMKVIPPISFNCRAIYLTSVSIPYTFYNIRTTNNNILINGMIYHITPQNYNSIQLAQELTLILADALGQGVAVVSFNKQKLKYTITTSVTFVINFLSAHKLFGFYQENITVNSFAQSNFIGDINDGIHSLIITGNFATPFSCLFNENFGTQIIARIPLENSKPGEIIHYIDENNQRPIVKNIKNLQYFEISILDDDLKALELNGVDYQVELFLDLDNEYNEEKIRQLLKTI